MNLDRELEAAAAAGATLEDLRALLRVHGVAITVRWAQRLERLAAGRVDAQAPEVRHLIRGLRPFPLPEWPRFRAPMWAPKGPLLTAENQRILARRNTIWRDRVLNPPRSGSRKVDAVHAEIKRLVDERLAKSPPPKSRRSLAVYVLRHMRLRTSLRTIQRAILMGWHTF